MTLDERNKQIINIALDTCRDALDILRKCKEENTPESEVAMLVYKRFQEHMKRMARTPTVKELKESEEFRKRKIM